MKTLNDYGKLLLTNTMSDLVEMFNNNSDAAKMVDALLSYTINTGIFRTGDEKINGNVVRPQTYYNITNLSAISIEGFAFYFNSIDKLIVQNLTLDLSSYNPGTNRAANYLIYLKPDLTFYVSTSLYEGDEDYMLFARAVINNTGGTLTSPWFSLVVKNAATGSYNIAGIKYQILNGLKFSIGTGKNTRLSNGVIKYSGINIGSEIDPDILVVDRDVTETMRIRYVTGANEAVDWYNSSVTDIDASKVTSNRATGGTTNVASGKFSCQKVFYDYKTKIFIIQRGSVIYDTIGDAVTGATNFNYDEPDANGLYIPIAIIAVKSGATDLTSADNCAIMSIAGNDVISSAGVDQDARDLADNAYSLAQSASTAASTADGKAVTAQNRADAAYTLANTANTKATTATSNLSTHTGNTNNPHNVTKSQIGLGNVNNTSDANKPISTAQQTEFNKKLNITDAANTYATKAEEKARPTVKVKSSAPTSTDFGRALVAGDIWIKP